MIMAEELIRPGKSLYFHEEVMDWFAAPILAPFQSLLGVKAVKVHSINGNCFNGDMPLDNLLSAFPHTDIGGDFVKALLRLHLILVLQRRESIWYKLGSGLSMVKNLN